MNEKLPTAEEFFKRWCNETKRSGGVLIGSSVREFLAAYESHTAAHTAALRERARELEEEVKTWRELSELSKKSVRQLIRSSERIVTLEAENARYRDRIGEALKFLQSRQQTTPGLGAPVTILKQALEK